MNDETSVEPINGDVLEINTTNIRRGIPTGRIDMTVIDDPIITKRDSYKAGDLRKAAEAWYQQRWYAPPFPQHVNCRCVVSHEPPFPKQSEPRMVVKDVIDELERSVEELENLVKKQSNDTAVKENDRMVELNKVKVTFFGTCSQCGGEAQGSLISKSAKSIEHTLEIDAVKLYNAFSRGSVQLVCEECLGNQSDVDDFENEPKYPDICPKCGAPSYNGSLFGGVDCSANCGGG